MKIITSLIDLKKLLGPVHLSGKKIGLCPTMGALHDGHLKLVEESQKKCDFTIVTLFVNPKQFGPKEDFSKYPRPFEEDVKLLASKKVDLVFAPNTAEMYPENFQTQVSSLSVGKGLCAATRPDHFNGVCTVLTKIFNLTRPHCAFFGKKDYQQVKVVQKLVEDLNLDLEIVPVEIVREASGLAMSSRNRYLSPEERTQAEKISQALFECQKNFQLTSDELKKLFINQLEPYPNLKIEYFEVRDQKDFLSIDGKIERPAVILVAVQLPSARLIDNVEINLK